jgi:adenylate cyclase
MEYANQKAEALRQCSNQLLSGDRAVVRHETVKLRGISQGQQVRLAGKPYSANQNLDYLIAISG